jgi:hypothetical protein
MAPMSYNNAEDQKISESCVDGVCEVYIIYFDTAAFGDELTHIYSLLLLVLADIYSLQKKVSMHK